MIQKTKLPDAATAPESCWLGQDREGELVLSLSSKPQVSTGTLVIVKAVQLHVILNNL